MRKRIVRDNDCVDALHPTKLTRRLSDLRLATADPESLAPELVDDEMDGVEARDFVYLNKKDVLDALDDVEIDHRFLKIPSSISTRSEDLPYFERPTQALIPYQAKTEPNRDKENEMSDD